MNCEVNERFPVTIAEEGTIMDFVDGEFVFVIKDTCWVEHERAALQQKPLKVAFVYKYDIAIFLLEIEDALDTSDVLFHVQDGAYGSDLFEPDRTEGYPAVLYLLDEHDVVQGKKQFRFHKEASHIICEKLNEQRSHPYCEEEFICNVEGLQNAFEPFELERWALWQEEY